MPAPCAATPLCVTQIVCFVPRREWLMVCAPISLTWIGRLSAASRLQGQDVACMPIKCCCMRQAKPAINQTTCALPARCWPRVPDRAAHSQCKGGEEEWQRRAAVRHTHTHSMPYLQRGARGEANTTNAVNCKETGCAAALAGVKHTGRRRQPRVTPPPPRVLLATTD